MNEYLLIAVINKYYIVIVEMKIIIILILYITQCFQKCIAIIQF